ncbi:LTA synthase family protein [Peteryoungia desertarenae]|nr:LTA synthase family protein [Peteryoungia desertarenae]
MLGFFSGHKQLFLSDPLYPSDLLFGRQIAELLPAMIAARPLVAAGIFGGALVTLLILGHTLVLGRHRFPKLSGTARAARLALAVPVLGAFASIMDPMTYSYARDRLNIIPMMWDQKENYRHNGFLLAFTFNIPMANVTAPTGYGEETIADISGELVPSSIFSGRQADVIMIMSESLWDPTRLSGVSFSEDPMPVIRSHQSGEIFSPEFGGLTANVEFEALTGFSNAFLPYGSIPYQQYIRRPLPSLATFFESKGYETRAFHPFQSWFWNRRNVYEALGFQKFESEETMPALEKRGIFASDEALTDHLIRTADDTRNPFFFFAVTLQGHGPYEATRYESHAVKVDAPALSPASQASLATFTHGVREADDSLKTLMDWARKRKRETIIVLFGDHLPPLGPVYTELGYMPKMVASRRAPVETMKREHETPLVIWSSKRGVQKNIGSISPSQLPHFVVRLAGYRHPFYTGVLGRVQERYSVIDRHQLIERNGRSEADWSLNGEIDPTLQNYRFIQYDLMFGEKHGVEKFFPEMVEPNQPVS